MKAHLKKIQEVFNHTVSDPQSRAVIADASIKSNAATVVAHVYTYPHAHPAKTTHHAMNVTSTEAELFAIRAGVAEALKNPDVNKIVIFTDSMQAAKLAIDPTFHPAKCK